MPCKTPQNGQATVAGGDGVAPLRLHMVQKGKHGICPEIIQRQVRSRSAAALSQEQEEEPERVTIRTDCVTAGPPHTFEVVAEEALDQRQEVILPFSSHYSQASPFGDFRYRLRSRLPASSRSSGVAVK